MKKFMMILFALILGSTVHAGSMFDGMSQEQLQDYEIVVVQKSTGKVIGKMSRATHKVVTLESAGQMSPQIAEYVNFLTDISLRSQQALYQERNSTTYSAILTAGAGKDGLVNSYNSGASQFEVTERVVPVGQATVCATRNKLGLCATASTNEFYGLGVKFDWK